MTVARLPAVSTSGIDRVELTISGAGISTPLVTTLGRASGNSWGAVVSGVPAGPQRTFQASAYDATGAILYQGQALVDVVAESSLQLTLVLQDPADVPSVNLPQIQSVEASQGRVPPSTAVTLRVSAAGGAGETLGVSWSSDCAGATDAGSFSDAAAANTQWTAPAQQPVTCAISVKVAGSGGSSISVELPIQVSN
ncbi:MAG TPA: hypothetical protein VMT11_17685 [Myxococcaceae bacterium]|nr:hypothetical protein [Myxococcaceae bacterium]